MPVTEVDLRVRIDRFTSVRAIAETNDGRVEMRSTWVNASGGCSAPPSAAEAGTLGDVRFRASADGRALQISIRHPNNSGFQIDPRTGDVIPPHYISHVSLSYGGQTFMEAQTGCLERQLQVFEQLLNFRERLASRRALKVLLLDQSILAGLGNLHAAEALWRARLSPFLRGEQVTRVLAPSDWKQLRWLP